MSLLDKMERNKRNVLEFYHAILNEKDFDKAKAYIGATYIQHNPNHADGLNGLSVLVASLREKFPHNKSVIKRIIAEDNYVILHVHTVREPGTRGYAVFDLFRLDDQGKVLEHWDTMQPIPDPAAAKNGNGML